MARGGGSCCCRLNCGRGGSGHGGCGRQRRLSQRGCRPCCRYGEWRSSTWRLMGTLERGGAHDSANEGKGQPAGDPGGTSVSVHGHGVCDGRLDAQVAKHRPVAGRALMRRDPEDSQVTTRTARRIDPIQSAGSRRVRRRLAFTCTAPRCLSPNRTPGSLPPRRSGAAAGPLAESGAVVRRDDKRRCLPESRRKRPTWSASCRHRS